ncbi:MAG: glycoside hydrolase family 16 protein [Ferruginibacter sp.]
MRKCIVINKIIAGKFAAYLLCACLPVFYSCTGQNKTTSSPQSTKIEDQQGYKLVWSDEFDKTGAPDTSNWRFEKGFMRNNELQWYQPENASCENGMLLIEARKENKPNPNYQAGSSDWKKNRENINYTASSINTSGKHSWQYGRFMMRARIDISPGLLPAWWTLGISGQWPSNGEIDIMEYYRSQLLFNIACGTKAPYKAEWFSNTISTDSLGGKQWAAQFHTWRMDWDENAIALYLDDRLMNKVELSKLFNKDGSGINSFKQPHYMLLNLAIGGQNGGDPSNTQFPNRFEVDYVRVYQK